MAVTTDLEPVASALEARSDEIVKAGLAAIRGKIPAYGAMDEAQFADVRGHVERHQVGIVAALRSPPTPEDLEFVAVHAARRARSGVPLADFLHAFRAYHAVLWHVLMEIVEELGSFRVARDAAQPVMDYIDLASTRAGEAYVEAQQLLLAEGDRVRRDLLDDLLAGRPPGSASRLAAARSAGLEPGVRCVVVVALPVDRDEEEYEIRARASALAAPLATALAPLSVVRGGEIVIVRAIGRDERVKLRERLEPVSAGLAVGVGTIQDSLAALPSAYDEASLAVRHVPASGGVVSLPDMSAFDYLTLREDDTAKRMVDPAVERFVAEDLQKGGALCDTLEAYAAADLNAKVAAERLFIHFNTAHYRLGKIEERTGRDMRRLADVVDLVIAIRLARRLSPA